MPTRQDSKPFTVFESNDKPCQFGRISFGVTNGVACFQRIIDKIIKVNNLKGLYAYLDNIVAVGINQWEYDENVSKFQKITKHHNLTFNRENQPSRKRLLIFWDIT